ncbi:MAG TPA: carboxypeptidase-like regulatory domain-containing protein, partial [Longimicrobiales bacterium]|nr:carboxypeptidase-like regulatory domain-containing protein [Longimicrobiales bacterium]
MSLILMPPSANIQTKSIRMRARASGPSTLSLLLALATVAVPSPARARRVEPRSRQEDSVTGRVVDAAGAPVKDARIVVVELDRVVVSDAQGDFALEGVPAGTYTVEVRRVGYRTLETRVSVPSADAVRFVLDVSPFALDPLN